MKRIEDNGNKELLAIVVVCYNRLDGLKRLCHSLSEASYIGLNDVPLVISVDFGGSDDIIRYAESFEWNKGEKYIIKKEKNLGLKEHILECGDLTKHFKGIILLEDDLYVSTNYYYYAYNALDFYKDDLSISGISLYNLSFNGFVGFPFEPLIGNYDVYKQSSVATWGECWNERMWSDFMCWYNNRNNGLDMTSMEIPEKIKNWSKAWSTFFYAYNYEKNLYWIFPYSSFTTNFNSAGVHGSGGQYIVQATLNIKNNNFRFEKSEKLQVYDFFGNNKSLYKILKIEEANLCLDLYQFNTNVLNKRYMLSTRILDYKIMKSFGLFLHPIELNVMNDVPGEGLFLYDTKKKYSNNSSYDKNNYVRYYLRAFNTKVLFIYLFKLYVTKAFNKLLLWKKK